MGNLYFKNIDIYNQTSPIRLEAGVAGNKTLPEAQRNQGIESITQIIPTAEAC